MTDQQPPDGQPDPQQPYAQPYQQPYVQPGQQQPYAQPYQQGQSYPQPYAQPYQQPYGYADPNAKSRIAAGLLGILLGTLGIHRFYLGYTGLGLTMLLISVLSLGFLTWAVAIWGLVEGILYLTDKTGSFSRDAKGVPLRD
ncbi:TM2 domain-containing protein [Isoptericola croceus]|uniref:TM2 domain-containing protein n=1 Tax=Isoptericola croceus TaxID=3031406 RepID=UPI0023F97D00|nr:TM2 domain-containing protein [Isoptericola croceus]